MHPYLKGALVCFVILIVLCVAVLAVNAGNSVPTSIVARVQLQGVSCAGPCCCGWAATLYRGHWYDTGVMGYCRWFRPLRDGQWVTTTLRLVR